MYIRLKIKNYDIFPMLQKYIPATFILIAKVIYFEINY